MFCPDLKTLLPFVNVSPCYAATLSQTSQLPTLSLHFLSTYQQALLSTPTFTTNPKCHPSVNITCSNTSPFTFPPYIKMSLNSFNSCHNEMSSLDQCHQLLQPPSSDRGSLLAWCILSTNLSF